jgi:hypothetical protein
MAGFRELEAGLRAPNSESYEPNSPKVSDRYREYSRFRETTPETGFDRHCMALANWRKLGISQSECHAMVARPSLRHRHGRPCRARDRQHTLRRFVRFKTAVERQGAFCKMIGLRAVLWLLPWGTVKPWSIFVVRKVPDLYLLFGLNGHRTGSGPDRALDLPCLQTGASCETRIRSTKISLGAPRQESLRRARQRCGGRAGQIPSRL